MVDCFFVGHNEIEFEDYEKQVRQMGEMTGAFRDLNLQYIEHENKPFTLTDVINYYEKDPAERIGFKCIFSATIAYLGSFLHKHGLTFDYITTFQEEKEYLKEQLCNQNIRAVAIPTTYYISPAPILEIMDFIRNYNSKVKIIIGGPFVATQIKVQDEATFDYICEMIGADVYINSSQGEQALVNTLVNFKQNKGLENVANIIYKSKTNYRKTEIRLENNPLEQNLVNWNLFEQRVGTQISIRTSISCPFSCAFCGFPEHAGKYQFIMEDDLCTELDKVHSIKKVKSINFLDDTFNVPPERFKNILRTMIKKDYGFRWNSFFRCQYADEEMVRLMKESGCEGVFLGVESGNQEILKNMNKRVLVKDLIRGMDLLKKYGITTYASFIVGFPGETEKTMRDTIDFIENTEPDFYRSQLWYCDPFTPIWKEKQKYGIENSQFEWKHNSMNAQQAADYIDEIFCNVKKSLWLPQNNFDYPSLFILLDRGWKLERIKELITLFNEGVKYKIDNPNNRNVDHNLFMKMQSVISGEKNKENNIVISEDFDF